MKAAALYEPKTDGHRNRHARRATEHRPRRKITNGGVDYALEAIGNPQAIRQAYEMTGLGGKAVVVGMAPETGRS